MNPEVRDRMRYLQRFRTFSREELQLNRKIYGGHTGKS
jgi:hypothetical protein